MSPIGSSRLILVGAASADVVDSNLINIFENLLTTDQYFVMHHANNASGTATMQQWRGVWEKFKDSEWKTDPEKVVQPFKIFHRKRLLSHPVWLVAHSPNTATDPVRLARSEDMQQGVAIKDSTLTPVN